MSVPRAHLPFLIVLALLACFYARDLDRHGMFMWDEAEYACLARSVGRGEGFTIGGLPNNLRPPVMALAGAVALRAAPAAPDRALKVPIALFALFASLLVYILGTVAADRETALVGATLLGVAPQFWSLTSLFLSEVPFAAFFAGALLALHCAIHRDGRWLYLAAACTALALLTRYTALIAGLIGLLLLALEWRRDAGALAARITSRRLVLALLLGALLVAPWLVRQWLAFGDPVSGFRTASQQLQVYLPGVSMPWDFYLLALPSILSWPVALLAIAGAMWGLRHRDPFALHCLVVSGFILGWFSAYRYKEPRLISSALPWLCLLAALGLTREVPAWLPGVRPRVLVRGSLALLVVTGYCASRAQVERVVTLGYPAFRDALLHLAANTRHDDTILAASVPQVVWYTDRATVGFPDAESFLDRIKRVRWIVVTNFERGQPTYAGSLKNALGPTDVADGRARVFRDGRHETTLLRADLLTERARFVPAGAAGAEAQPGPR